MGNTELKQIILSNIAALSTAEAVRRLTGAVIGEDGQPAAAQLKIFYSGGGDSGGIEEVTVVGNEGALHPLSDAIVQAQCEMTVCSTCYTFDAAGNYGAQTTVAQKTMSVEDAAEHILNNLIELTDRSGWENGDGGSGEAYFDLQTGKLLSFVHTVYYTESDTTEYEPDELFESRRLPPRGQNNERRPLHSHAQPGARGLSRVFGGAGDAGGPVTG
ncbi:DUF6878 family protein [Ralstonia sp. GP71]|uniref:DUF6878 family protein n=3 Tax=Pseudomonadota TaxID=1224 RepID=UPI003892CC27